MDYTIKQFELGPVDNFIYLLKDNITKQFFFIDPAWESDFLIKNIIQEKGFPKGIILTHSHNDHINAIDNILKTYKNLPIYLSKKEFLFWQPKIRTEFIFLNDEETFSLGKTNIKTHFTPGHSPGSLCFELENDVFTGDTLFIYGCGNCSLYGGDSEKMYYSLEKLKKRLPKHIRIFSGHNYGEKKWSSFEEQKNKNPFLQISSKEKFIDFRENNFIFEKPLKASDYSEQ